MACVSATCNGIENRNHRYLRQLVTRSSSSNSGATSAATVRLHALLQQRRAGDGPSGAHRPGVPQSNAGSDGTISSEDNKKVRLQQTIESYFSKQSATHHPVNSSASSSSRPSAPTTGTSSPLHGSSGARYPSESIPSPRFLLNGPSNQWQQKQKQPTRDSMSDLSTRLGLLRPSSSPAKTSNTSPTNSSSIGGGENPLRQHLAQIANQRTMAPSAGAPLPSSPSAAAPASGSIADSLTKLREQFLAAGKRSAAPSPSSSTAPFTQPSPPLAHVSRFSVPSSSTRTSKSSYQQLSFKPQQPQGSSKSFETNHTAHRHSPSQSREHGLFPQRTSDATQWSSSNDPRQQQSRYTSPFSVPEMPLSDIIKSIQLKNSETMRQSTDNVNENGTSSSFASFDVMHPRPDIIPKWRQPGLGQKRVPHQRDDVQHRYARMAPAVIPARRRPKPVFADPRLQTVVVPSFEISLTEASSLFRTKTSTLANLLRGMGEDKPVGINEDSWMVSPDALGMIALELGVTFENAVVKHAVRDDEALLLMRRAAASMEPGLIEATTGSETMATSSPPTYESYPHRPPVVCIMGHVDHGKTTLMDALRRRAVGGEDSKKKKKTKEKKREKGSKGPKHPGDVAGTEAGGITQVISAFQVPFNQESGYVNKVTFLDTPGHAAFTAMRQSGSDAADIIVLVVAADDGVSEQTVEILDFYKSIVKDAGSGGISLVIAMNKIDKPGVEVEESTLRIQSQLLEHGILTEGMPSNNDGDYGSPVQMKPVSGLTGTGLDDLIEGIALQSEVMDLRAPIETRAEGIVMDARIDKGVGIVADCIIRWGSLQKGDIVVSGTSKGKVRLLKDSANAALKLGLPSQPVRIVGFDDAPKAGDPIVCVESEEVADDLIARRKAVADSSGESAAASGGQSLELQSSGRHMMRHEWKEALEKKYSMDQTGEDGEDKLRIRIPVVIKADADGTLAAIRDSLLLIGTKSNRNVVIEPVKLGVGPLLATEIQIAKECNATIICFNLKNEQLVTSLADENGVSILRSDVIYTLLDEAKIEFAKYLAPEPVELIHGRAKVQAVYDIGGKLEKVAGLMVTEGTLFKSKVKAAKGVDVSKAPCHYRVTRGGATIVESLVATSLKHFKEDVEEVARGKECGISLIGHDNFEKGDELECFTIEMKHPSI